MVLGICQWIINCGSSETSSPPNDSCSFLPDSSSTSISISDSSSQVLSQDNSPPSLYSTSRVSSSSFSYELTFFSTGDHVVCLHFFPFSSPTQNLFSAKFKVFYGDLFLLENSRFPPCVAVNEFFIRATVRKASVSFQATSPSVAFISAVEFFSALTDLFQANGNWKGLSI